MNATTWEQWFHGKWEYRMYRKARRTRDIRAVYWSEVMPRHFRGAYHSKSRKAVLYKSSVGIEPTYRPRDFYVIAKLLRS